MRTSPPAELTSDTSERISSAIYGLMVTAVTMLAGATHSESLLELVLLVLVTNVVYYLTHLFAELVAPQPSTGHSSVRHHAWLAFPMVSVGFTPLLVTVAATFLGASLGDAIWYGLGWTAVGFAGAGWLGLRRRGLAWHRAGIAVVLAVVIGAALVAAKLTLH